MDYVSDNWLRGKASKDQRRARLFYDIYQALGTAWHYYGLQCRHRKGNRRVGGGRRACRVCGRIEGTSETEYLLPSKGKKTIGRHVPSPRRTGTIRKNRAEAILVDDEIRFHGARLIVRVHHAYQSRLVGKEIIPPPETGPPDRVGFGPAGRRGVSGGGINIASERSILLREGDVEISVDDHLAGVRFVRRAGAKSRQKGTRRRPVYGGFAYELPKKLLRKFPVIFSYDSRGRLEEVEILR